MLFLGLGSILESVTSWENGVRGGGSLSNREEDYCEEQCPLGTKSLLADALFFITLFSHLSLSFWEKLD